MAWIETHQSLLKHPKTTTMVGMLQVDRYKLIGHLVALWHWGLDVADIEGRLPPSCNAVSLADAAGWPIDDAERFVDALVNCGGRKAGFVERRKGGFILHDWWFYAGKYNAKRVANAQRMKQSRATHVQRTNRARAGATNQPDQHNQPTEPTNLTNPERLDDLARMFGRFGKVTAGTAQSMAYAVEEYGLEWVEKAVRTASGADFEAAPPWSYVEAILKRWRDQGKPDDELEAQHGKPDTHRRVSTSRSRSAPASGAVADGWDAYKRGEV